ncbi:MAG: hypothetical protein I8H66_12055 [Sphingobacteriia bacterium]|nr:hypothetical protein [Sphingobacteriia bacterium]
MAKHVVIKEKLDVLPISTMTWERFQTFSTDVLATRENIKECREYLVKGNKQDGIDIYAFEGGGASRKVAQCKRVAKMTAAAVDDIINEFLAGQFAEDTDEFILCTSASMNTMTDEQTIIANARAKLAGKKISLTIWDEQGLSQYFRLNENPAIVYRYFNKDIAEAFYGEIWKDYLDTLQEVPKISYLEPTEHIARSVHLYLEGGNRKPYQWRPMTTDSAGQNLVDLLSDKKDGKAKRVTLLSIAGFGKSQELQTVAACFSTTDQPIHPVRYFLQDYQGQSIEELLQKRHDKWRNIPRETLLLIFDGMDELKEDHTKTFIDHLNMFADLNKQVNILVSSRFNFYDLAQPPLRYFDVYTLESLTHNDIQKYLEGKLLADKIAFETLLHASRFAEYANNPYYLTRLVKFYLEEKTLPKNKSALFNMLLFEQLGKDEHRFNLENLKQTLLPLAEKVAFCMTLTGKSSLTNEELSIILPDSEQRKQLRNFCILNYNDIEKGTWSFEHKNMQEYLCASFLSGQSFSKIHNHISFSFNPNRLLPRFLNTISFLFEILDKESQYFKDLFKWLQDNQPELFVRFEKEQIDRATRITLFKSILQHYHDRNLNVYFSSNLSNEELADFVEIDGEIIDYLGSLLKSDVSEEAAYDLLQLISSCKKHYIYRQKLLDIYFFVLQSPHYSNMTKAHTILCMEVIDPNDHTLFDRILSSGVDLTDFDVRRYLISFLENSKYAEKYIDIILESIPLMDNKQTHVGDGIVRLLLDCEEPGSILKIIKTCSDVKSLAQRHYQGNNINFEEKELAAVLEKAEKLYPKEPKILPAVYKLFRKIDHVTLDDSLRPAFLKFFANTCGNKCMFQKIYSYDPNREDLLYFAGGDNVNFLVAEFLAGNLTEDQIAICRNRLSWINISLAEDMTQQLIAAGHKQFYTEPNNFDYHTLEVEYRVKNQKLLFDRQLFNEEVDGIFKAAPQPDVTIKMLHDSFNKDMRNYRYSIVKDAIGEFCRSGSTVSKETFLAIYENENYWLDYSLGGARNYVRKESNPALLPEFEKIVKDYLVDRIQKATFEHGVKDAEKGSVSYNPHILFLKELYTLFDVELDDPDLLKMLQADYSSYFSEDKEKTVSAKILERVKDRELLRQTIVCNIRSGKLASWVLSSHYKLCQKLKYQEVLPDLYNTIVSNTFIADHDRHNLVESYIKMGGDILDFKSELKLPPVATKEEWRTWEWYLLQSFTEIKDQDAGNMLVEILKDDQRSKNEYVEAVKLLLQMGRREGLYFWCVYVRKNKEVPFEFSEVKHIAEYTRITGDQTDIRQLVSILEYAYDNELFKPRPLNSIQETVYAFINQIAIKDIALFEVAKTETERLIEKYKGRAFQKDMYVYLERLSQKFYENHEYNITLETAAEHFVLLTAQ